VECQNAQLASEFLLLHGRLRHGRKYLCAKTKSTPPFHEIHSYAQLFQHYHLKAVREDSQTGLLGWLTGEYPLEARLDVPTPREMLDIQCQGRRIATLLLKPGQQNSPIGRHAGAYEFLLHDLEHAHKFFGGEFEGQVRFFKLLRKAIEQGHFQPFALDAQFENELNYLMSDMNSHPVHLLKYLKAIALNAFHRLGGDKDRLLKTWSEELFDRWGLPAVVKHSALKINYPGIESDGDRHRVAGFFSGVIQ